ncbi:MAG: TadE/TadG family type IV pilus assembly protein [Thermoleophilia bacterium]
MTKTGVDVVRTKRSLSRLVRNEGGSFLVTGIFLAVIFAIMAILIIDGASVFQAYESSKDVSEAAAIAATDDYKLSHNLRQAEQVAADYCESRDLVFIEVEPRQDLGGNAFSATCEQSARTYVFKKLPWFKDMVIQRNTGTSYRSI